jgi:hypothetical protein
VVRSRSRLIPFCVGAFCLSCCLVSHLRQFYSAEMSDIISAAGANTTNSSYSASVVKTYNATDSPARFENKNIFFCFEIRFSLRQCWRCSCKFKSHRIGSRVCSTTSTRNLMASSPRLVTL